MHMFLHHGKKSKNISLLMTIYMVGTFFHKMRSSEIAIKCFDQPFKFKNITTVVWSRPTALLI